MNFNNFDPEENVDSVPREPNMSKEKIKEELHDFMTILSLFDELSDFEKSVIVERYKDELKNKPISLTDERYEQQMDALLKHGDLQDKRVILTLLKRCITKIDMDNESKEKEEML